MVMTEQQEEELDSLTSDLERRHRPPPIHRRRMMAIDVLRSPNFKATIGRHWLYNYFDRHTDIGTLIGDLYEAAWINQATEKNVRAWFDVFRQQRDRYHVSDRNINNTAERGLCIGNIDPRRVVDKTHDEWGRPRKRTKMRNSQDREWVSLVECISAGVTCIQPLSIFEGVKVKINSIPDDSPPYKYTADPFA